MKISRREIIGTAILVAATPAAAQDSTPPPNQDWLAVSADQNKRNAEALAKIDLPQATEPAFAFKP